MAEIEREMTLTDPSFEELRDGMKSLAKGEAINLYTIHDGELYSLGFKFVDAITDAFIEFVWQEMRKSKEKLKKKEP